MGGRFPLEYLVHKHRQSKDEEDRMQDSAQIRDQRVIDASQTQTIPIDLDQQHL